MTTTKITKSPYKHHNSIAFVIPNFIVKALGITEKSRLTISLTDKGFRVRVRP